MGAVMPGFYWLVDGVLAGCSRPGEMGQGRQRQMPHRAEAPHRAETPGHTDEHDALMALERDLRWLRGQGIRAVLSLTETPLVEHVVAGHGLTALHLPVPDLHPPTPDQFMRALGFIDRQRALDRAVVVHCLVGQGRTGTVLAAYRIRSGASPAQALYEIRAVCPGAVGSSEQEEALRRFAARQDWIL